MYSPYQYLEPKTNNVINILFVDEEGKRTIIKTNRDEVLLSLFKKYTSLTGKNGNFYFVFCGKPLDPIKTLKQYNLISNSTINVEKVKSTAIGGGGFSHFFTDLSKKYYNEITFTSNAPIYRNANQGINIFGDCKYEKCEAFNKEVVVPLLGIEKFDLIHDKDNLKCPACKGLINPKTVGFYLCEYKIKGKNYENNEIKSFEFFGKASSQGSLQYYDPIKNGNTLVLELIIEIINYF